ncbi:Lysine histidine transporter-like 6, partial [Linum grandiflorum]
LITNNKKLLLPCKSLLFSPCQQQSPKSHRRLRLPRTEDFSSVATYISSINKHLPPHSHNMLQRVKYLIGACGASGYGSKSTAERTSPCAAAIYPPSPRSSLRENNQSSTTQKWTEEEGVDPNRRAKWWYSTFHSVTAMIGAGVLGLPSAMAYLGWGPGTMMLVVSWCLTLNTMWQMIQLHECVQGTRFDRYIDLGRHAFGKKLGPWIVLPQQLIVQVGCNIVHMVTGGQCLKKFMEIACSSCTPIKQSYWILMFGGIHFFLSQLPNFNSVAGVSLAVAVMSL